MRLIWTTTIGIFIFATTINAQTLGQVADKERDRRARLGNEHTREVITEEQLGSGEKPDQQPGQQNDAVGQAVPLADDEAIANDRPVIPDGPVLSYVSDADNATADPWPEIYDQYRTAYQEAKAMLNSAQAFESYCEDGTAPPEKPGFRGWYWTVDCASMPGEVARAAQSIKDIENACHDHARRLRILPGRARLQ